MDVTAAPGEVQLGENFYRMSPLTDRDLEELDNWLRVRIIRLARRSTEGLSEKEATATMNQAFAFASKLSWTSDEGASLMATRDGVAKVLFQGIHANHPEVTEAQVYAALVEPGTVRAAMDVWRLLNIVENPEDVSGSGFQEEASEKAEAPDENTGVPAAGGEVQVDAEADSGIDASATTSDASSTGS
jgi:hypothetical protein